MRRKGLVFRLAFAGVAVVASLCGPAAEAHGIGGKDAAFVAANAGPQVAPFLYLGAKHMVTGYDHLLFIFGVIFFLYRLSHVALYVTLFSLGHSITLLVGVLGGVHADPRLVDAVIGLSVVYKAFENLDGFAVLFGVRPDTRIAVLVFGLVHGFGLATKLQALNLSHDGLLVNMISFNVGVEIGQLIALAAMLMLMTQWRHRSSFGHAARWANVALMASGFILVEQQLADYFLERIA